MTHTGTTVGGIGAGSAVVWSPTSGTAATVGIGELVGCRDLRERPSC